MLGRRFKLDQTARILANGLLITGSWRGLHICTSHVQNKKATRKMLVANGFVQKEVCVRWYQFVSRFEVQRI
jgi:hypothetical protein